MKRSACPPCTWRPRLSHSIRTHDGHRDGVPIYEGYTLRHDIFRLSGRDLSKSTLPLLPQRGGLLGISSRNCVTLLCVATQSSNRSTARRPASSQTETSSLSPRTSPLRESVFFRAKVTLHPQGIVRLCRVVSRHDHVQGFIGTHDQGIDGVGSIHGEIKVATPIRYGLEDFSCDPSAFSRY